MGVDGMPTISLRTKNGFNSRRGILESQCWRTWCDPNGGPYKSAQWDGHHLFTGHMPTTS